MSRGHNKILSILYSNLRLTFLFCCNDNVKCLRKFHKVSKYTVDDFAIKEDKINTHARFLLFFSFFTIKVFQTTF